MQNDVQKLLIEIEKKERLFHLFALAWQEKESADAGVLRALDEMLWEIKGDPEQHERLEETRRYIEILNIMSANVLEEEENRLNYMLENIKDEAYRNQERN